MKIYVASSWKNKYVDSIFELLDNMNISYYNFKDSNNSFHWNDIDKDYKKWNQQQCFNALHNEKAIKAFENDFKGLKECTHCILILPCGKSSHLEAGFCIGQNKKVIVYVPEIIEPELMYKMFTIVVFNLDNLRFILSLLK